MSDIESLSVQVAALAVRVARLEAGGAAPSTADAGDIDSEYGNFEVKRDPRDWKGPSCVGKRLSECPPEFLDLLAGFLDWAARKADQGGELTKGGKPVSDYKRKDAARCRAWAARHRAGWSSSSSAQRFNVTPPADRTTSSGADDDIPF